MLTPKKHDPGGGFFSAVLRRRHDESAKAWGRKPLSQILRQRRESLKISLPEAARLTGVPVKYLHLLEEAGDEQILAEPLSLIPALPRYAAFLNLNPDIAVAQFIAELEKLPPVVEARGSAHRTQLLKYVPRPQSHVLPRTFLLLLALGLLVFVGSYSALTWKQQPYTDKVVSLPPPSANVPAPQSGTPPPTSSPARPVPPPAAGQQESPAPPSAVSPSVVAAPRVEPSVAPTPRLQTPLVDSPPPMQKSLGSAPHRLRVQAKAKTWLHVTIDKQPMKRLFLQPGQSLEWTAEKGFTLSLGNAGAIRLTLDGHELPPLGKAGQMALNVRLPSQRGNSELQVRNTERPRVTKPR